MQDVFLIRALVVILVFEYWLLEWPMFNYHSSKYLCLTDTSLNNINQNINVNLLNDNSNYKNNSNLENRTEKQYK